MSSKGKVNALLAQCIYVICLSTFGIGFPVNETL